MDKFIAIFLSLITPSFLLLFHIVDFTSFIFQYATLIAVMIVFISGYESFIPIEKFGFLLFMLNKAFECIEEVQVLHAWLNNRQIIDFLFGDVLALTGVALVAIGVHSRLKHQKQQLNKDPLTSTYNKFGLEHITQSVLDKSKKTQSNTSILIIDVDKFKKFNDTYGHLLGDKALITVTNHLKNNIRAADYLGRWGGDEFVIICPNTSENEAIKLMKRIQNSAMKSLSIKAIPIRLSIGATTTNNSLDSFTQIFREADRALYQVKEQGRNGYKHYQN
ncbi:GGDEF domain-containing protein [Vibrio sp. 03-59-1]|uniref:GGDEF domain-containing protein n=1 Tax=Vibrio TaxID=662 RepID=UPI0014932E71|nr:MULTISPECIES: GGDEF domain-containing protein [Vibrio]NOH83340.1 GGDEF domain-containing protein [Vibrio sp. 03-59-1]